MEGVGEGVVRRAGGRSGGCGGAAAGGGCSTHLSGLSIRVLLFTASSIARTPPLPTTRTHTTHTPATPALPLLTGWLPCLLASKVSTASVQ